MKKYISIAFAAVLACLTISCQKEDSLPEQKSAPVQYTFDISVNEQLGFDNGASTKGGGSAPTYKSAWENGDKIFLFFKPDSGSLLTDTYATLIYDGSDWGGSVTGFTSLDEGGTLSAVYVYKLGSSVTPEYSDGQWTIPTGNVFYNCQSGVSYTVSGDVISASLNLEAPADFVCFSIYGITGDALTCDKVKGWKDVVIGSEMTISNATCTGYMVGFENLGNSMYKDFYGRIVSGTSLNGTECTFSVVKNGKVYEHTATPSSDKRSFSMSTSATGDLSWSEASGKLPGLFTVGIGSDGKAGTADDVQVRFSKGNLWYGPKTTGETPTFNFEADQYAISPAWDDYHLSNFYWSKTASSAYSEFYDYYGSTTDVLFTNATETTPKADFTVNGTAGVWRALSRAEWQYLLTNHTYKSVSVSEKWGIVIAPDGYSGSIADTYEDSDWATAEAAGLVFLPSTGFREDASIKEVSGATISCIYWTSTAVPDNEENAYRMFFQWNGSTLSTDFNTDGLREWAVGIRLITDVK